MEFIGKTIQTYIPSYTNDFNLNHALELRYEGLNSNKSRRFIGFGIAPL